jgi:thioredoxin 1
MNSYRLAPIAQKWRAGRIWMILFGVLLMGLFGYSLFFGVPTNGPAQVDNIPWQYDLNAALEESKRTHKLVLADFSAGWCGPCQEMKRTSWPDKRVEAIVKQNYIPVLMDVDATSSKVAAQRYNVQFIPAVFILDAQGRVIREGSLMSGSELAEFLQNPQSAR